MTHRSGKTEKRELLRKWHQARVILRFWSGLPYRIFWHRVLGHRFSPEAVWARYDMKAEKQIFRSE